MSGNISIQGMDKARQLDPKLFQPDVRPTMKKFADWIRQPSNMVISMFMMTGAAWYYPSMAQLIVPAMIPFVYWGINRRENTVLKMPVQSGMLDPNEINPSNGKMMKAQGIFCLGNDLVTGKEIWLTNDDCRQHFLVLGTTGAGKLARRTSNVHTPEGWRQLGSLKVGDKVSCPVDGGNSIVTGLFPQGIQKLWKVNFKDGRSVEVGREHLWEVHHKHWVGKWKEGISRAGMAVPRVMTTEQLKNHMESYKKGVFCVPLCSPMEKQISEQIIPAYLMGAMLGDGHIGKQLSFCSVDVHNVERVSSELFKLGYVLIPVKNQKDFRICRIKSPSHLDNCSSYNLKEEFSSLELLGCRSWEKFIPDIYKNSSIEQRWALVQGMMDTDGTCDVRKPVPSFRTTSLRMAKDFQEVVWSLGGIAKVIPKQKTYTHKGEKKIGRVSYNVGIRHPEPWRFFSLPRKVELASKPYQYANQLKLAVTSIEPDIDEDDTLCIMVDHPRHLYVMDQYIVTHNTELLIGFAANAISWGSGLLYCDGKGDVSLFAKMYALARKFGREDDLLVLNFMNGNKDDAGGDGRVRSNTLNPFANGASDSLTQMIVGLMAEAGGDGAMWKGRAVAMLTGVIKALVWLRDKGELDLNVGTIREYMNLKNIISLASEKDRPNLPKDIRTSVRAYLTSLPGFVETKGTAQAQTTLDQHGYLEMQFSQIFGSLNDVYGHIFKSAYGQIDMSDVVLNRRILVIMLPALEKSGDEIANLGKIVAANLKGMMGGTLGANLEGSWDEVVERRPTSAPSPFLCILDEVGYYTVDGMALMAAQARSLGFSMVYASQDIPAMQRNNEKEAASIIANTNTKIFMRTEEADKTGALAVNSGGEAHRVTMGDMEKMDSEMGGGNFRNGKTVRFEEKKRISFLDLKSQGPGELTITYKGEIVRGKAFYADPSSALDKSQLYMRANHFIEVVRPDPNMLTKEEESLTCMNLLVAVGHEDKMAVMVTEAMEGLNEAWASGSEIAIASKMWGKCMDTVSDPITASACVIAQLGNSMSGAVTRSGRDMQDARNVRGRPSSRMEDEEFPNENDSMVEDYMGADRMPMERKRSKVDPTVKHGVSVDGKESWDSGKGLSNKREIIKCLADLDFDFDDAAKTPQQIDQMLDENLGVPEKTISDAKVPERAQQFEDVARSVEEIRTDPELPPRRQPSPPTPSTPPVTNKTTGKEGDKDKGEEGSGSGGKAAGNSEALVEDFISQLMGGGS